MLPNAKTLAANGHAERKQAKTKLDEHVEAKEVEIQGEVMRENESLKSKLHEVRLRNAEYRSEI